ncbi:MAG: MlaA family lipoprotein [Formivibrio sp.]|nr:MlaA family lipoprotein [Formivibrio sp.]
MNNNFLNMSHSTMRYPLLCLAVAGLLAGCATSRNNYDPLESINRPIYSFNKGVDKVVLHPLATAWTTVLPSPVQTGVHNFFENIVDLFAIPAALLQGKGTDAAHSFGRVVVNTTVGIGGLIDVASKLDIPKSDEDFGQVLGYWGVPTGPYLMLPLLGPITVRDAIDPAVRFTAGPTTYINPESARYAYVGVNAVDARAQLLPLDKVLDDQYDQYAFVRDTYLQRRWYKVYDGNPPYSLPMAGDVPDPSPQADAPVSSGDTAMPASPASAPAAEPQP